MKRILATLLVLSISLLTLASCFGGNNSSVQNGGNNQVTNAKIRIGALSGPTGMGMAKMISDNGLDSDKYAFTVFGSPEDAKNAFAAGDVDAICFPTNTAANLFGALKGELYVAAINCLGSLYLITDAETEIKSISDLEGKTIYASVPNSTTAPIVNYILEKNNVNATVSFEFNGETLATHDQLSALIAKGEIDIAVLPEPKATATIAANSSLGLSIDLNLSTEWDKISSEPLTMGCIIFKKSFADANKSSVNAFLDEYKASIEYINDKNNNESAANMIFEAGILPKAAIAKKALGNLYGSIVYLDGEDMKSALTSFYSAIGMSAPADSFYYEK